MKSISLIAIIISLVVGLSAYISSNNYFIAIGVFLILMAYFFLIASRKIKQYLIKRKRIHDCYHFVNSFLITMSVKDSLEDSYRNATQGSSGEYLEIVSHLDDMNVLNRINYLRKYFDLAVYKMFINVLNLYLDQGGNLITMSENIMQETSRIEETLNKTHSSSIRVAVEFSILWLITFSVLIFLRFGVSDFYLVMLTSIPFMVSLIIFYILFLISVHVFIIRFCDIYVKEDKIDEEN